MVEVSSAEAHAAAEQTPAARARRPAPFLKWAGGKTQLLAALDRFFPAQIELYAEPFVGSAAVFFYLRARGALAGAVILADVNEELINVYLAVRDEVEELLAELARHKARHSREHYYETRARPFAPDVAGAARTIYLNKTCFNGLYRVNRRGEFNVPMGRYVNPGIFDPALLRAASAALQGVELRCHDFRATIDRAAGGILYVDPPYVPLSATSSFTGYAAGGFGDGEQEALADCLHAADARGVRFVLSNSYTPLVRSLYAPYHVYRVPARRAINSNAARRGVVDEAVVVNFAPEEAHPGPDTADRGYLHATECTSPSRS